MTTTVSTPVRGVTTGGLLRSEWLKLVTVRSTFWTTVIALVLAAAVSLLLGATVSTERGALAAGTVLLGSTASLSFVALIVGVLGVLSVGGEYATLQIRSSYTAVPRRWPALVAKGVVVGAWSFVLGLVVTFGGYALLALVVGSRGVSVSLGDGVLGGLLGGAAYLAVVAVFAVGLGALVRSSAAGITILTALLFVAPVIVALLGALLRADWVATVSNVLLASAGSDLSAAPGSAALELWAAVLVLAGWVAVAWAPALLTTVRRDV